MLTGTAVTATVTAAGGGRGPAAAAAGRPAGDLWRCTWVVGFQGRGGFAAGAGAVEWQAALLHNAAGLVGLPPEQGAWQAALCLPGKPASPLMTRVVYKGAAVLGVFFCDVVLVAGMSLLACLTVLHRQL
jgi:hypothetical protein